MATAKLLALSKGRNDDVAAARQAVADGAAVNSGQFGHTALHNAATGGLPGIITFLATEGGADFNFRGR